MIIPNPDPTRPSAAYGVHSEVGRLRKVLVCRPGLAHRRLTRNSDELLFDDVLWVDRAIEDHAVFTAELTARGVEVVELHDLLAQTVAMPEARRWLLDRRVTPEVVGHGLVEATRDFLDDLAPDVLAEHLVGVWPRLTSPTCPPGTGRSPSTRPTSASTSSSPSRTRCTRETRRAGSTAGSRSTRCTGRRATTRRSS